MSITGHKSNEDETTDESPDPVLVLPPRPRLTPRTPTEERLAVAVLDTLLPQRLALLRLLRAATRSCFRDEDMRAIRDRARALEREAKPWVAVSRRCWAAAVLEHRSAAPIRRPDLRYCMTTVRSIHDLARRIAAFTEIQLEGEHGRTGAWVDFET